MDESERAMNKCVFAECKGHKLEAKNKHLQAIAEYARHKEGCKPRPDKNECDCGYLQVLKDSKDG